MPIACSMSTPKRRTLSCVVSYSVTFHDGNAYAILRATGTPSLQDREAAITELLAMPGFGTTTPILIDGRDVETLPSEAGLKAFAEQQRRRLREHRVAFLMNPGIGYGVARQISTFMELKDIEVRAFDNESAAVTWLLKDG